jgi:hypothetical protein
VIATRWGLPSAPRFSRLFRRAYGCSPRQFRQRGMRAPEAEVTGDFSEPVRPPASWPLDHGDAWAAAGWKSTNGRDG